MIERAGDRFWPAREPFEAEELDRPDANSRGDRPQLSALSPMRQVPFMQNGPEITRRDDDRKPQTEQRSSVWGPVSFSLTGWTLVARDRVRREPTTPRSATYFSLGRMRTEPGRGEKSAISEVPPLPCSCVPKNLFRKVAIAGSTVLNDNAIAASQLRLQAFE